MLKTMCQEIKERKEYLNNQHINSIYFGGGTPSILNTSEIKNFLKLIYEFYKVNKNAEITIECNPDDINKLKLLSYKKIGINRLSIGVQSFNNTDLKFMNRTHTSKQAIESIKLAKKCGFKNISVDLIYGLPNQTLKKWEKNLDVIFNLKVQHFSAYSLTIEEKTALYHLVKTKKITLLPEDKTIKQFKLLQIKAKANKFLHYEISNFGKKGYLSNHNVAYWKNRCYIGIGPSAHSYNGDSRRWNVASNKKYISNINSTYFNQEFLTTAQQYNEYIFTSLRTIWGTNKTTIKRRFGNEVVLHFLKEIEKWELKKNITSKSNVYRLTSSGKIFADRIASDLFIVT